MSFNVFITGTDTAVGKTYVSTLLLQHFAFEGYKTLGIKPIASGCFLKEGVLYSEDALILQKASSVKRLYSQINPIALEPAIAPHIAAELSSQSLTVESVFYAIKNNMMHPSDFILIEGAGGWLTPLNREQTYSEVVKQMKIPVILVVGMRLGCINHALLTAGAIRSSGVPLLGWVANCIDPEMPVLTENIQTLMKMIDRPCLGVVPFQSKL